MPEKVFWLQLHLKTLIASLQCGCLSLKASREHVRRHTQALQVCWRHLNAWTWTLEEPVKRTKSKHNSCSWTSGTRTKHKNDTYCGGLTLFKEPFRRRNEGVQRDIFPAAVSVCASLQMLSYETLSRNTVSQPPPSSSSSSSSPLHGSSNVPGRSKQQTTCTSRSIGFHPREAWRRHASRGQATFVFHDAFRKLFLLFPCDAALDWEAARHAV